MTNHQKQAIDGAKNLLINTVKAKSGDRVLIVGEQGPNSHFDSGVCNVVDDTAKRLDLDSRIIICEIGNSASECPQALITAMEKVDHTLFFSRLGDQLRFTSSACQCTMTMCYVMNVDYLASDFCRTPFEVYEKLHERLIGTISTASAYQINCPQGTALNGELSNEQMTTNEDDVFTQFEVQMFPLTIFPPVSCATMSGVLVLKDWLTSSSTVLYEDSVYFIDTPVTAKIKNGLITQFDGEAGQCQALEKHFQRVSEIVGGEAMAINSWHTGIIPSTWYAGRAQDDLEKWGSVSYASPRITHFHACGSDPGQIGVNLFDASIKFDEELIWQQGHYLFPRLASCADIFDSYPEWKSSFLVNGDIGVRL